MTARFPPSQLLRFDVLVLGRSAARNHGLLRCCIITIAWVIVPPVSYGTISQKCKTTKFPMNRLYLNLVVRRRANDMDANFPPA